MKLHIKILLGACMLLLHLSCNDDSTRNTNKYIIEKENGQIILAYKAFRDFLDSDRSWESYKSILLDAYPQVQVVHNRQLGWGVIDSIKFPQEIKNYKKEDLNICSLNTAMRHFIICMIQL